MGIGAIALALYQKLACDGVLRSGQSIMELGSQDLYVENCQRLVWDMFGALQVAAPAELGSSSREFMERLGFDYACIDSDGRHGALSLDLNEPVKLDRQFDIVTNHGTTEHVFDQANCFRTIHDLTKRGGVMIHCVPMQGYVGHCFYLYLPEFFKQLAADNGYETIGIWTARDDPAAEDAELIAWPQGIARGGNVLLAAVLRRTSDAPFRIPFQTSRYARPQAS